MPRHPGPGFRSIAHATALTAAVVACGEAPTVPPPPPPVPPIMTVFLAPEGFTIGVGSTLQFSAASLPPTSSAWSWRTTDATIATVSAQGLVTGVGPGTVGVVACLDSQPAVCGGATLHVAAGPNSGPVAVIVSPGTSTLNVGETISFTATPFGFSPMSWGWSLSDPTRGVISSSGVFVARRLNRSPCDSRVLC